MPKHMPCILSCQLPTSTMSCIFMHLIEKYNPRRPVPSHIVVSNNSSNPPIFYR